MKPDDDIMIVAPAEAPKPWAAILIGAFLSVCGIAAGGYGIVAVTWSGVTTAEIVQIESPAAASARPDVDGPSVQQNGDGPLRTSTTRRRTIPRSVARTSETVATTAGDTPDTTVTRSSLEESPSDGPVSEPKGEQGGEPPAIGDTPPTTKPAPTPTPTPKPAAAPVD